MSEVRITAIARTEFGKGGARRTRRAGNVPAVLYGHGQDPVHLSLPAREFAAALKGGGVNTLLTLVLDGGTQLALPKAVQRDPIRGSYEHVDLLIVRRGEKVTVEIRVVVTGEPAPDTLVNLELQTVSVEAPATAIPEHVEVDVTGKHVGDNVTAADLRFPGDVTLVTDAEILVVGFLGAPTAADLEEELAEAEAEAGIERDATDEEIAAESAAAEESGGEGEDGQGGDAAAESADS